MMEIHNSLHMNENECAMSAGRSYGLQALLKAIDEFRSRCPIKGGLLNRNHVEHLAPFTHEVHDLEIRDSMLVGQIQFLENDTAQEFLSVVDHNPRNICLKPIIVTPLSFSESGVTSVLEIRTVQLEAV